MLAAIVVALPLIAALYANALRAPFQFDDRHAIVENPLLRAGNVDSSWWGPQAWRVGAGHYRPLTFATYALNIRLGGLDPVGFHLFNVTAHWAATALLAWLVWLLSGRAIAAIAGAALFAVTPANSEAVNYLAARSSLLVGVWSGAAVLAFVLFRRAQAESGISPLIAHGSQGGARGRWAAILWGAGALAALGLGLASKELAIAVPLVWICYDVGWSRKLGWKAVLAPYAIVAALAAGYFATTGYYRTLWAVASGTAAGTRDVWVNLWSQLALFPMHLAVFAWPFSLNVLRDVPMIASPWQPAVLAGAALLLLLLAVAAHWLVRATGERRLAGFLVLWFVISLLPAMIYPLHVLFQEHRDYMPWMGLAGAAGIAAWALAERVGRAGAARGVAVGSAVVVLGAWSAATVTRNTVWTDALRLWSDAAAKSPNSPVARLNLGTELARRGESEAALREYREAIRVQPDYGLAYYNVGLLHVGRGEYAEARTALERAAALTPDAAEPLAALGAVYAALGDEAQAGDALDRAAQALDRRPHPPAARLSVAEALAKSARWPDAARHYRAVLDAERGRPSFLSAKAYLGLGFLAERAGRPDEALAAYGEALGIDPRLNDARFNSANVLAATGRLAEAAAAYEGLLRDAPSFFPARFNLGRLYEREGRADDARREYQAFLRDAPSSPAYASARRYAADRVGAAEGGDLVPREGGS